MFRFVTLGLSRLSALLANVQRPNQTVFGGAKPVSMGLTDRSPWAKPDLIFTGGEKRNGKLSVECPAFLCAVTAGIDLFLGVVVG